MTSINLSLRAAHVASGDDSNQIYSDSKDQKEPALRISAAENAKSNLRVRVRFIRRGNQGLIEKNLLTFKRADLVFSPDFIGVLSVPLKPEILGEISSAHDSVYYESIHKSRGRVSPPGEPAGC